MRKFSIHVPQSPNWRTHIHGVPPGRLLAGVAFGEGPIERVGESILAQVAKNLLFDLEGGEVGCKKNVSEGLGALLGSVSP